MMYLYTYLFVDQVPVKLVNYLIFLKKDQQNPAITVTRNVMYT